WSDITRRAEHWFKRHQELAEARASLEARWTSDLMRLDLATLHAKFSSWATAFFLFAWIFLWGPRRQLRIAARGALPPNVQIARDLGVARELPAREQELSTLDRDLELALGEPFRQHRGHIAAFQSMLTRSERSRGHLA